MAGMRSDGGEQAARINVAVELVEAETPTGQAIAVLVGRFGCSPRQARRYLERAARSGRVPAPEPATVFTVKLAVGLAGRVRAHAAESGRTLSAVVAQALEEFLARHSRGRRER